MAVDAIDANLSKYRLIRLLGAGGMGEVYLARDLTLERDVAIKFLSAERTGDADALRRFVREAQSAAALEHPGICAIHEVVADPGGRAYIVMQYLEGETLADRLNRGPLEPREALTLAMHVAEALSAAHRAGIVHRDLKPQNIMLTRDGRPKLLDFGIAKVAAAGADADEETQTSITGPGRIIGTPGYMSPEQVQQRPIDGRSDLFSLGAVLFECFTGRRPFKGRNTLEICGEVQHVNPPPPSSLRPDLTDSHDELCGRLLAKNPADRFQSAEELLGAIRVLLPGTGTFADAQGSRERTAPRAVAPRRPRVGLVIGVVAIVLAAIGMWRWRMPEPLPVPTPDAEQWYRRGTEAVRDGSFYRGQNALQRAVELFPEFPQAFARLAEAQSELNQDNDARLALLRVNAIVPDQSRLPADDRLRLDAIRARVLGDMDIAVQSYQRLVERNPRDDGALLDLGRAQSDAGFLTDAGRSFERAVALNAQSPAAHLRLAAVYSREGRRDDALKAFDSAEQLYQANADQEGQTEVLLRRGAFYESLGELSAARATLERAAGLAANIAKYYELRCRLALGNVTASEGRYADAEKLASSAIEEARQAGLDGVAAEGLIDLGTIIQAQRPADAEAPLSQAIQMLEQRGASVAAARAKLQFASLRLSQGRPADALGTAESVLPMLRTRRFRRYELTALSIISRAHEDLDRYDLARPISRQVLEVAEAVKDEGQMAVALDNLASQTAALGQLPEALEFRVRSEEIHRRQQDAYSLPFDLTGRAELLIRLGRGDQAEPLLVEVEAGAAKGLDSYIGRARRVGVLRALRAAIDGEYASAARHAEQVIRASGKRTDSTQHLASALFDYANAARGRRDRNPAPAGDETGTLATRREIRYWRLAATLAAGQAGTVLAAARTSLDDVSAMPSDEYEWRLAALGALAARRAGADADANELSARADAALARLRTAWQGQAVDYEKRRDLVELRQDGSPGGNS